MVIVHRSNRVEVLAGELASLLAVGGGDPFSEEWIIIQNSGMAGWLTMELSRRLGIVTNVRFPFPRSFLAIILKRILGERLPDLTLFHRDNVTWHIMSLLPSMLDSKGFEEIQRYLVDDDRHIKLYQISRQIGKLFDDYAVYRPEIVLSWEESEPAHWQGSLWKRVIERMGSVHLATVTRDFIAAVSRGDVDTSDLPERIFIFGINSLPPLYFSILSSLSQLITVHLFAISPSQEFWATIRKQRQVIRGLPATGVDRETLEKTISLEVGNPLLASLGKLGRDFQYLLEDRIDYHDPHDDPVSLFVEPDSAGQRLLTVLQSDMMHLRYRKAVGEVPPLDVDADDGSLTIHSCHSALREVEVLHDILLDALEGDTSLNAHDIVVLAPEIEAYSPLIEAVFGSSTARIPFTIIENRRHREILDQFMACLRLSKGRVTIQDVFDILRGEAISATYSLSAEEVEQLRIWTLEANIRWGLDGEHRREENQPGFEENSWRFGLDRLTLGVSQPAHPLHVFGGILPYGEIEGTMTDVLGRFLLFCDTLFTYIRLCRSQRGTKSWRNLLLDMLDDLFLPDDSSEIQVHFLREALAGLSERSEQAEFHGDVSLDVIIDYLSSAIEQSSSPSGGSSGAATFASLSHMRSIPFRIVCLLGMNDGAFPRSSRPEGFDLMALSPRTGDRSSRHDDRYLFLEAMLMARDRLIITYQGRSAQDNSVLPPSVIVNELIDCLSEAFTIPGSPEDVRREDNRRLLLERLCTVHPLQPFSPRYFDPENARLFSYSQELCQAAIALSRGEQSRSFFLTGPLPHAQDDERIVTLRDLITFFEFPARYFLRKRFDLHLSDTAEEYPDREPISLDALERYAIGMDLLSQEDDSDSERVLDHYRAAGQLPPGTPGRCSFETINEDVRALRIAVSPYRQASVLDPLHLDINLGGTRLIGHIGDIRQSGRIRATFGKFKVKYLLELWISHLAMAVAAPPDYPLHSVLITRDGGGTHGLYGETILAGAPADSRELLLDLISLFWSGHSEPLRFFPTESHDFARKTAKLKQGQTPPAELIYPRLDSFFPDSSGSPFGKQEEHESEEAALLFGPQGISFTSEFSFGELALRVFNPILTAQGVAIINVNDGGEGSR